MIGWKGTPLWLNVTSFVDFDRQNESVSENKVPGIAHDNKILWILFLLQLLPSSQMCRAPGSECDVPEFCDGLSGQCPVDVYAQNGHLCDEQLDGVCYEGQCESYKRQCGDIWGEGRGVTVCIYSALIDHKQPTGTKLIQ